MGQDERLRVGVHSTWQTWTLQMLKYQFPISTCAFSFALLLLLLCRLALGQPTSGKVRKETSGGSLPSIWVNCLLVFLDPRKILGKEWLWHLHSQRVLK